MFKISPYKLNEYFNILGFKKDISKSGKFYVWDKNGYESYGITVTDESDLKKHSKYYTQNLRILKDNTGYDDNFSDQEFEDIVFYNKYVVYNRAATDLNYLPFDYSVSSLNSIVSSFKTFSRFDKELKDINFTVEIGHTKKGSFVTPIYLVPENKFIEKYTNETLRPDETPLFESTFNQNTFGKGLSRFFDLLGSLEELNNVIDESLPEKVKELGLSASMIETFMSENSEFQKSIDKYKDTIKDHTFSLDFAPIIDYPLENKNKRAFNISKLNLIKSEIIEQIKQDEDLSDENLNKSNVNLTIRVITMHRPNLTCSVWVHRIKSPTETKLYKNPITAKIKLKDTRQFEIFNESFMTDKDFEVFGDISKKPWYKAQIIIKDKNTQATLSNK